MSEKKKKVFISGPMSGIKDYNKPAFDKVEQWLTQAGYSVFNPARMHFDDTWTHEEIMKIDLAALAQCDYVLMLPKWYYSKGSIQEYHYANAIGVEVMSVRDMEPPKKESKPKQRIEIETFGDISGENLDFLKWVEKHCNEILAKGGKLTEGVEVQIDSATHDVLRMMAYLNNHSVFDWVEKGLNPKPDTPKTCGTCKHNKGCEPLRTCSDCGPFKNWEPKDAPTKLCVNCRSHYEESLELCESCNDKSNWMPKKTCQACKYRKYTMDEEPCKSCGIYHTKWKPKEEE